MSSLSERESSHGSQARSTWNLFDASTGRSYVITLFLIRTPLNVVKPFRQVCSPSESGGILINLGPLFWTPPGVTLGLTCDGALVWVCKIGKWEYTRDYRLRGGGTVFTTPCQGACLFGRDTLANILIEVSDPPLVPANGFDASIWPSGLRLRHSCRNRLYFYPESLCMQRKRKKTSSSCLPYTSSHQGERTAQSSR